MNPILQALQEGYSEDEVLNYMTNAFPHLKKKITSALNTGHSAKQVINFLSGLLGSNEKPRPSPSGSTQQSVSAQKTREDEAKNQQLLKTGLSLAGGAVGARALQSVAPKIAGAISSRGLPKAPGSKITQGTGISLPGAANQLLQAPNVPTPPIPTAEAQTARKAAADIIKEMGLDQKIQTMAENNPPEILGKALKSMLTPGQKSWLKTQTEQPFEEIINEYMMGGQQPEQALPREEGVAPVEKSVLTPSGDIGQIVDEKQGIATVQLPDGKKTTKKLDELIHEPEDAAVTALELIKTFTPEERRSTHHALSFYDPESNEAFFMFHNGDAYKIGEVTPEEYQQLSEEVVGAKTTGETIRGQYASGAGSRGAAYNLIVKAGKKPYKKLQVGYDFFRDFQKRLNEAQKKAKRKRPE